MRLARVLAPVLLSAGLLIPGVAFAECPDIPAVTRPPSTGSPFDTGNRGVTSLGTQTSDNVRITGGCIDVDDIQIHSSPLMNAAANNATLPDAVRGLGLSYTVKPGGSIQAMLAAAKANGGGTVYVQAGTYAPTTTLIISSNTHLVCEKGAIIQFNPTGWVGVVHAPPNQNLYLGLTNENYDAGTLTDSNITVEGCTFQPTGTFAAVPPSVGWQSIAFRMAQHIRIIRNGFDGGGDGTAMLASKDTEVSGNWMTNSSNACYDHWEAPQDITVTDNYCQVSQGWGTLVTGTNSDNSSAQVAKRFVVKGNKIVLSGALSTMGIWANGLGAAGSGASNGIISNNIVISDGTATTYGCIKVSGGGTDNVVTSNTCDGAGSTNGTGIMETTDTSGSFPTNTIVSNNIISNITTTNDPSVIYAAGARTSVVGNIINGGAYSYLVSLAGTDQVVHSTNGAAGASGKYEYASAIRPSVLDLAGGKNLTVNNSLTLSGTDGSTVTYGTGGAIAYAANKLSVFAATTSAELAGVISDETGSGKLVFADNPVLTAPSVGVGTGAAQLIINGGSSGSNNGAVINFQEAGALKFAIGAYSAIIGGAFDDTLTLYEGPASGAVAVVAGAGLKINTKLQVGSLTALTLATGEAGYAKIAASGTAPGAAGAKEAWVCGTNAGTAKKIAYAGTSTTPVTIIDNVGSGVSGC